MIWKMFFKRGLSALTVAVLLVGCSAPTKPAAPVTEAPTATQAATEKQAEAAVSLDSMTPDDVIRELRANFAPVSVIDGFISFGDDQRIIIDYIREYKRNNAKNYSFIDAYSYAIDKYYVYTSNELEKSEIEKNEKIKDLEMKRTELEKKIKEGQKLDAELEKLNDQLEEANKLLGGTDGN